MDIDYSLSSTDVLKIVERKANLIIYSDLRYYSSIYDVMKPHGACIILFINDIDGSYGHWTCVLDRGDRVEFFDSYSMKPDEEFGEIDPEIRRKHNYRGLPYLSKMLYDCGKKIEYNHGKLQSEDSNVSTCGRWVALRILFKDLPLQKFIDMMKSCEKYGISSDELAVKLTNPLLKK